MGSRSPTIGPPYRVFAVSPQGGRRLVDTRVLVIELAPGVEVELNLAPHPNYAGQLSLMTPPARAMKRLHERGVVDSLKVNFSSTSIVNVSVERSANPPSSARGSKKVKRPSLRR